MSYESITPSYDELGKDKRSKCTEADCVVGIWKEQGHGSSKENGVTLVGGTMGEGVGKARTW